MDILHTMMCHIHFANCWAHVRRYWLKAESKNGRIGVDYCDRLYRLERKFKKLRPSERRKARQKESKPIVEAFFKWIDESPFYGKNALAKAAEYTLKYAEGVPEGCAFFYLSHIFRAYFIIVKDFSDNIKLFHTPN